MTDVGNFIGHLSCDTCEAIVYIDEPDSIKIWHHPDDPGALAEVVCSECGNTTSGRIPLEHMVNFRVRGCSVLSLSDKFEPLTEEAITEWAKGSMEAELEALLSS